LSYDSISPIDGRYASEAKPVARFFSERAFAEERFRVELDYLALLIDLGIAPKRRIPGIRLSMPRVKALESKLGHDVKAVEVFIREALKKSGVPDLAPYVHIGLTSEDTNSLAHARLLSSFLGRVLVPSYVSLAKRIAKIARNEAQTQMLARTHGRPAVPTTFGKEMAVFAVRIAERVAKLRGLRPTAKFSGAVGTYASFSLLGRQDWAAVMARFVESNGVDFSSYSTQVVPGERLSDILHCVINLNQLMISLCRDLWMYQSFDYVRFERQGKVSSSTMPQKVNPVDLENAEGQAEISNAILSLLAYRLQLTRMQRDLSDSVLRRMVGQGLAHSFVARGRVMASLSSMHVDREAMKSDLTGHPEVFSEAKQISMRLSGDEKGYEKVKESLEKGRFSRQVRVPKGYLGMAPELARDCPSVVSALLRPRS